MPRIQASRTRLGTSGSSQNWRCSVKGACSTTPAVLYFLPTWAWANVRIASVWAGVMPGWRKATMVDSSATKSPVLRTRMPEPTASAMVSSPRYSAAWLTGDTVNTRIPSELMPLVDDRMMSPGCKAAPVMAWPPLSGVSSRRFWARNCGAPLVGSVSMRVAQADSRLAPNNTAASASRRVWRRAGAEVCCMVLECEGAAVRPRARGLP